MDSPSRNFRAFCLALFELFQALPAHFLGAPRTSWLKACLARLALGLALGLVGLACRLGFRLSLVALAVLAVLLSLIVLVVLGVLAVLVAQDSLVTCH